MSGQGWYDAEGVFHEGPPPQPKAQQNADLEAMQRQMEELQRQIQAAQQPAPTPEPAAPQPASPEQQLAEMQRQMAEMQAQLQQQTGPVEPLPAAAPVAPPAAPVAPVAQPAPAAAPVAAPQPQPEAAPAPAAAVAPVAPVKGTGGLKALLTILIVLLALTLAAIGWVAFSGFSLANGLPAAEESADEAAAASTGETVEVVLAPATAIGATAFSTVQYASGPDPAVAKEASGEAEADDPQPVAERSGDDAGLYLVAWGTASLTGEAPSLLAELTAEPARAEAFVAALNSDPDLGWSGALTVADLEAYLKQLSFVALAEDTLVTHHAYSGGTATATQAVLQKGSVVLIDRYGVPRLRAVSGDPLTAPDSGDIVATAGKAWPDFDASAVVSVAPAASVQNSFQITSAGATVEVAAVPCRGSGLGAPCDPPSATATIAGSPATPADVIIPTVTTCAPALAENAPKVDFRWVNNSGKTLYMFMVEAGSCTVTQPYDTGSLDGYSGGWKSFGETPLPEGVTWVVSDGTSTTPLATLTAKNGAQIVE